MHPAHSRHRSQVAAIVTLLGVLALSACHGANVRVRASGAQYPISLSAALPDAQGNVLVLDHELESVASFEVDTSGYGFFYGMTSTSVDLSDEVNSQVKRAGGEGIVQFEITSSNCTINYLFPFTILPIWPGCQDLKVRGVIVRRKRAVNN